MNNISIQVISDIHIELYRHFPHLKPLAPYLFMAGDIGNIDADNSIKYKNFLSYCSEKWEKVFVILGNHEFYQKSVQISEKKPFQEINKIYAEIFEKFNNVYLLNDSSCEVVPGLNVYGTTLWTKNYGFTHNPGYSLNDYNMISMYKETTETNINIKFSDNKHRIRTLSEENNMKKNINLNNNECVQVSLISEKFINDISTSQLNSLNEYLNTTNTKTIIMTHFPPFRKNSSNPIYSNQPIQMKNYFSWLDIHTKLNSSHIAGWICGHTHWSYDLVDSGIRFISNQMGYKEECVSGESNFECDKIYTIEY